MCPGGEPSVLKWGGLTSPICRAGGRGSLEGRRGHNLCFPLMEVINPQVRGGRACSLGFRISRFFWGGGCTVKERQRSRRLVGDLYSWFQGRHGCLGIFTLGSDGQLYSRFQAFLSPRRGPEGRWLRPEGLGASMTPRPGGQEGKSKPSESDCASCCEIRLISGNGS